MSGDPVWFAFFCGASIGFLAALILAAKVTLSVEKIRISRGMFESRGIVYRITEFEA